MRSVQRRRVNAHPDKDPFPIGKHDLRTTDWIRRRDWSGERPFVLDPHRQKLHRFYAAARRASRVPPPPGEQQIGIDAVALGHLRHGRGRREALGNQPPFSSLDQNRRRRNPFGFAA